MKTIITIIMIILGGYTVNAQNIIADYASKQYYDLESIWNNLDLKDSLDRSIHIDSITNIYKEYIYRYSEIIEKYDTLQIILFCDLRDGPTRIGRYNRQYKKIIKKRNKEIQTETKKILEEISFKNTRYLMKLFL